VDPGRAVLWDAHCGEPIGWHKLGEPIIAGPGGGGRSVTYGETTFTSRRLDPRDSPYATGVRVVVDDPDREWPCPKCGAAPGELCKGPRSGKH
jgi:hypothetical protein